MAEELAKRNKEKFFRGENVEDLKKISTREFAKLVKARARRTLLRNYNIVDAFVKKLEKKSETGKITKTHDRTIVIVPRMIDKTIGVYNGKEFIKVMVNSDMLGHRLGEFSMTRKIAKHTSLGKKK